MFIGCCFFFSCKQEADESLNFEEQILEAAKSIAAATSALVKAASAAQRELVAQGKVRQDQPAPPKSVESHLTVSTVHSTFIFRCVILLWKHIFRCVFVTIK